MKKFNLWLLAVIVLISTQNIFSQKEGSVVNLNGGFVAINDGNYLSSREFSFDGWVKWDGLAPWERIFDFGSGTNRNMFFTPWASNDGMPRFAFTVSGATGEQRIHGTVPFPVGVWVHVAIVIKDEGNFARGFMYLNGTMIGSDILNLFPSALGYTYYNYFGKSQYPADANLRGKIDGFRFWNRSLTHNEVFDFFKNNSRVSLDDPSLILYYDMTPFNSLNFMRDLKNQQNGYPLAGAIFEIENQAPNLLNASIGVQYVTENCEVELSGSSVSGVTDPDGDDVTLFFSPSKLTLGTHNVLLTANDGKGGISSKIIEVNVSDNTAPIISEIEEVSLTLGLNGVSYDGANVEATDNCDQNLIVSSSVEFPVLYTQPGVYIISYTVTDASGNSVSAEQTINVESSSAYASSAIVQSMQSLNLSSNTANQHLSTAVNLLNQANSSEYWVDGNTLSPITGAQYYELTKEAVQRLATILKLGGPNALNNSQKQEVMRVINSLVALTKSLAQSKIAEVESSCTTTTCNQNVQKAKQDLAKGDSFASSANYNSAIQFYKQAWEKVSVGFAKNGTDLISLGVPTEYSILQNYPNPFNPSTNIRYGLSVESNVVISVYNMLGQEIAVLKNEVLSAGFHEVTFDASGLTSGIYLYKINAESLDGQQKYSSIMKMILMK
ncbi:MAG: T9SS type A sorting domain-containing protein [Ignavibacteriaceae bacterium]|nr:T9SS type A sorting domain-containing protein [Ignavibacteriaceae bacterium]